MTEDPKDVLSRELTGITVRDGQDLLLFLPLAARLAALGDRSQLERWRSLAKKAEVALPHLLADRAGEGIWDLEHAIGEDLGLAVIAAQDFACFSHYEQDILLAETKAVLETWAEQAEETPLDDEAVETLELFLERFALPESMRLRIVDAPLSTWAEAAVLREAELRPTVEAEWPVPVSEETAELLMLDGGAPSDTLKNTVSREAEVHLGSEGLLRVARRLSDNWEFVIDIDAPSGAVGIQSVRAGLLPASPAETDREDRWLLNLRHLDLQRRLEVLEAPIVINLRSGIRVRLS